MPRWQTGREGLFWPRSSEADLWWGFLVAVAQEVAVASEQRGRIVVATHLAPS